MRNEAFILAAVIIVLLWLLYTNNPKLPGGKPAQNWWADNIDTPLQKAFGNLFGYQQQSPSNPTGAVSPGMGAVLGHGINGTATQNGVPIMTSDNADFTQRPADGNAYDWITPVHDSNGDYGFSLS